MKLVIVSRFVKNDEEDHAKVHKEIVPVAATTTPERVYNTIRSIQKSFLAIQGTKGILESVVDDTIESISEMDFGFVACTIRYANGDVERAHFHASIEY